MMMYYGCKKCEEFAHSNPDQFFSNEGRCPDCMDDHESMINHIEWQKFTVDFSCPAGDSIWRGMMRNFAKDVRHWGNAISGEINS